MDLYDIVNKIENGTYTLYVGKTTLISGSVTVLTPYVSSDSLIYLWRMSFNNSVILGPTVSRYDDSVYPFAGLEVDIMVPGESFSVTSKDGTNMWNEGDESTIGWVMLTPKENEIG